MSPVPRQQAVVSACTEGIGAALEVRREAQSLGPGVGSQERQPLRNVSAGCNLQAMIIGGLTMVGPADVSPGFIGSVINRDVIPVFTTLRRSWNKHRAWLDNVDVVDVKQVPAHVAHVRCLERRLRADELRPRWTPLVGLRLRGISLVRRL